MKTSSVTLKRGSAVLGAVLCATMGLSAFGAVDITNTRKRWRGLMGVEGA